MSFEYIYDGCLSERTIDWVTTTIEKYPYPVEVYTLNPPDVSTLTKHVYYQDNDPGLPDIRREGSLYCCGAVNTDSLNSFYFFKTEEDRELFIAANIDTIVDVAPFKTKIMPKSFPIRKSRIGGVLSRVYALLSPKD